MRKVSKTKLALYHKYLRQLLTEHGAIEMSNTIESGVLYLPTDGGNLGFLPTQGAEGEFILETRVGLLWLKFGTSVGDFTYVVYGRFENVKEAVKVEGLMGSVNPFSAKFNHHSMELGALLNSMNYDLSMLAKPDRVVVNKLASLEDGYYEQGNYLMVVKGVVYHHIEDGGSRMIINTTRQGKKEVFVNGVCHTLSKSTKFMLVMDGAKEI